MSTRPARKFAYHGGRLLLPSEDSRRKKLAWIARRARERDDGQCRDWPWARTNKGYGVIRWQGPLVKVGHLVLEQSGQPRPEGLQQLHSCDRPECAARWHLRWGTAEENRADMIARGRGAVAS